MRRAKRRRARFKSNNLRKDLLSYWALHEGAPNYKDYVSGHAFNIENGTVSTFATAFGPMSDFNGSSNIEMDDAGDARGYDNTATLSFTCWAIDDALAAASRALVSIWSGSDNCYAFLVNTGGMVALIADSAGDPGNNYTLTSGNLWAAGDLVHLGYVFDGNLSGAARMKCYFNGVDQGATETGTIPASLQDVASTGWLEMGALAGNASNWFDGKIGRVGCWTRALTSQDISDDFNNGHPLPLSEYM
jgi:hypothetical protein